MPLDVSDGAVTLMGRLEPEGETDWYAVTLEAGELLTVEARPHCGSNLDTLIGVYGPDKTTQVASADDGGAGGWTLLSAVPIATSGTYSIGLTAFKTSGSGSYLLDVQAAFPPPCATDAACGCPELVCTLGQCVPGMDESELEPNDTAKNATPIALLESAKGAFDAAGDADWYVVALLAGAPVTIRTGTYCGASTDPAIALYDELGQNQLAGDEDSGGAGQALVQAFVPPASGLYRIKVTDQQLSTGPYVLRVDDARCKSDSDCACADASCNGTPASPGMCVPALQADEAPDPTWLKLGTRVYAAIDAAYDLDAFTLSLAPGTYDIETLSYCGSDTDTELVLIGPDGMPMKDDADSGDAFFAKLSGVVIDEAGSYTLEVTAYGPGTGEYLIRFDLAPSP